MPNLPPSNIDFKFGFMTNYFLQGCVPPFWAVVEFSQEPAGELVVLLLGLNAQDIAQGFLSPKGSRQRRTGRHGRKSGRRRGFPDINDIVGQRIGAAADPGGALQISPTRWLLRIVNVVELTQILPAVIDLTTDIGFNILYGALMSDKANCPNLAYFSRVVPPADSDRPGEDVEPPQVLSIIKPFNPINLVRLDGANRFIVPTGFGAQTRGPAFKASLGGIWQGGSTLGVKDLELGFKSTALGEVWSGRKLTLAPFEISQLMFEADFPEDDDIQWIARASEGTAQLLDGGCWGYVSKL